MRPLVVAKCLILLLLLASPGASADDLRRGYADSSVGQLHYREIPADDTSDSLPLVLLHLVPNSSQVFDAFMLAGDDGRRQLAFDLPGFGMSDPVTGDETVEAYAQAILASLDALGVESIDLLGYHTGAAVAAEMMQQRPDLVRKLVLVAIPLLTDEERAAFAALPPIAFDEDGEFAKTEWQRSLRWRGPGQSIDSVKKTYAEKMRPGARERGAKAVVAYDLEPALRAIDVPLMVLRPKDDLWEATDCARSVLTDAAWIDLPQYGHGMFHVAPDELASTVFEFLQSN